MHMLRLKKILKIAGSHTETSQVNCNESDSIRNTYNAQVEDSMTESLNKLKEIRTSR